MKPALLKNDRSSEAAALGAALLLLFCPPLLFNRGNWYPAVHLFKWIPVFVTAAYGTAFCGFLLASGKRVEVTRAEASLFALVLLLALQPLVLPIRDIYEWLRNWLFLAATAGCVFFLRNLPLDRVLPAAARSVTLAGAISVSFGFLQQARPGGIHPFVASIAARQDRFMANTGMDSILGTYLALAIVAGVWLAARGRRRGLPLAAADLVLLAANCIGLWKAASRSSMLACAAGVAIVLALLRPKRPSPAKAALLVCALAAGVLLLSTSAPDLLHVGRRDVGSMFSPGVLSQKNEGRWAIWGITREMIVRHPLLGVGLGNYKWHYLDAMADFMAHNEAKPRYTHWAHNEYLQLIAETGAVWAALFLLLLCRCAHMALGAADGRRIPLAWALGVLGVLAADSLFSRPMHHVETAFSLPVALALISRLCAKPLAPPGPLRAAAGVLLMAVSALGLVLFTQSFNAQRYLGKYFYNLNYITMVPSEEREKLPRSLLFGDAYAQLIARENYTRTLFPSNLTAQHYDDAIRMLAQSFEVQPRYEELNMLMMLYQKLGRTDEARPYLKYYPEEERQRFADGTFDGKYMED